MSKSNIKLIALGGVRENGKNLYVAEVDDSIFVLDVGLKYPENEQLGVDYVVPNMDYLFENKERIAGVFLTHGHADAIGALPNLLADAKVPVFGSELTIELAKLFVKNNDAVKKFNDFHVIDENTEIEFGKTVVSFFRTTHSIPERELSSRPEKAASFIQVTSSLTSLPARPMRQTLAVWLRLAARVFWPCSVIQPMRTALFRWLARARLARKSKIRLLTGMAV